MSHIDQDFFIALLDHIDEEVLIAEGNGSVLFVNNKVPQVWGGCIDDYVGKDCRKLTNMEFYGQAGRRFIDAALDSGERISERYTDIGPDGKARHYLVRILPFYDCVVAMARLDVTKETELQQRLQVSQKMAVVGEMMAHIAHEIRNPLLSIGGFASSLAKQEDIPTQYGEKVTIIANEAKRLEDILNVIIQYSKPAELKVDSVDVNQVASAAVGILTLSHEYKDLGIKLELANSLPKASADSDKLTQCLINLIKNAREAVDDDGSICVRTRYADGTVYLEVEDNGSGIPDDQHDAIFKPYVTTKPDGSGLGLAITRKLIMEMGGRILLRSKFGVGTLFSIVIPPAFDSEDLE